MSSAPGARAMVGHREGRPGGDESMRELLRYVLQEFQAKGGRLTLPVGCYQVDDWLLDAVNVPKLLNLLQTEREVQLVQACEPSSTRSTPGPLAQGALAAAQEPESLRPGSGGGAQAAAGPAPDCELQLPLPSTGLTEGELQELAYTVFVGSCSGYCSDELADDVRRNLQMTRPAAASLQNLLLEAAALQSGAASSLEMLVLLLRLGRPRHFQDFAAFLAWRSAAAHAVCQALALGAAEGAADVRRGRQKSLRKELQRLRMTGRMLAVPSEEEYEEEVYGEAAAAFVAAAGGVARESGLGWGLPWPVRVRIAELLMGAGFDAASEGAIVEEQPALAHVLAHHLWPLLGLPPALHALLDAWAYLRQFALTGNVELLLAGRQLIEGVRPPRGGELAGFTEAVLGAAADWAAGRLGRCQRDLTDAGPVPALLEVLAACKRSQGQLAELPQVLEGCIAAGVRAECERGAAAEAATHASMPKAGGHIVGLAARCSDILDEEVAYFAPLFSGHVRRPAEVAAIEVHRCFNRHLLPWLQTVHTLEDSNLEAIRAAVGLEAKLQTLVGERLSEGLDWAIIDRLAPLLHSWVARQLAMAREWYGRIVGPETWAAVSQPRGASRSAVELVKIVRETLEALFELALGLPDEVVLAALAGLDDILQTYAGDAAAGATSTEFLVPPLPGLTRYKREVAIKAAAADTGPNGGLRQLRTGLAPAADEGPRGSPQQEALASGPATPLLVRANSLAYVRAQLPALAEIVAARWGAPEGEGPAWAAGLFEHTRGAIAHSIDCLVTFTAMKAVQRDLAPAFDCVYRHDVAQSRLAPLLDSLDEALGNLCGAAEAELHPLLARALLGASVNSLLRVLLHGGPNRWFKPGDVELIEADAEALRALFCAEGEGLDPGEVAGACSGLGDLLTVLALETPVLVENLKQVRQQERLGRAPGPQPLVWDSQVLLHVLAHREDHAASKYLKKEFALPKRLDSGASGSLGKKLSFLGRR